MNPGQWVYRETEISGKADKLEKKDSRELWSTADDNTEASYYNGKLDMYYRGRNYNGVLGVLDFFPEPISYRSLGSLPVQPGALVTRLAEIGARSHTGEPVGCSQSAASCTAFLVIAELLSSYLMPPALTAELYQALGDIPGVSVVSNVDVAGQPCTGFRIPLKGGYVELIINSSTYQYVATQGSFPGGVRAALRSCARRSSPARACALVISSNGDAGRAGATRPAVRHRRPKGAALPSSRRRAPSLQSAPSAKKAPACG